MSSSVFIHALAPGKYHLVLLNETSGESFRIIRKEVQATKTGDKINIDGGLGGGTTPDDPAGPEESFSIPLQLCGKHDSCFGRCLTSTRIYDATSDQSHFNCFCDSDCEIFK